MHGYVFGFSILFHWLLYVSLWQYYIVLTTRAFYKSGRLTKRVPPWCSSYTPVIWAILASFFHIHFQVSLSCSSSSPTGFGFKLHCIWKIHGKNWHPFYAESSDPVMCILPFISFKMPLNVFFFFFQKTLAYLFKDWSSVLKIFAIDINGTFSLVTHSVPCCHRVLQFGVVLPWGKGAWPSYPSGTGCDPVCRVFWPQGTAWRVTHLRAFSCQPSHPLGKDHSVPRGPLSNHKMAFTGLKKFSFIFGFVKWSSLIKGRELPTVPCGELDLRSSRFLNSLSTHPGSVSSHLYPSFQNELLSCKPELSCSRTDRLAS